MSRHWIFLALSLCLTLGFSATGPLVGSALAQENDAAPDSPTATAPVPASPSDPNGGEPSADAKPNQDPAPPAEDSATDSPGEPPQPESKPGQEKPANEADQAKPDADPAKKSDEKSGEKPDEKSGDDKPADADGKKRNQKAAKSDASEPKRLPKLGDMDGPLIPGQPWRVHDFRRPRPAVVSPGELSTYDKPGTAPSDAIVLFDGKDLSNWCHISSEDPDQLLEPRWKVENGYFEVTPRTGNLYTIDSFGSCQLHIEWQAPEVVRGDSQGRGNSGIHFMEKFEIQVLDSYNNRTYADGQAGAIYGRFPPMVNASRKPGEWQVYDILFEAPKFSLDGELERPASVTVMHNGIFLHHARDFHGPSGAGVQKYSMMAPAAPIRLQDHGNPVRFRNVWVRPLTQLD